MAKMKMRLEGSVMGQTVKGAPYSADEVTQSTQVLADGTRIHHENKVAVYRDGEGRVRRESSPDQISIIDPVAHTSYFLNPKTMTAQKAPAMMGYSFTRTGGEGVAPGIRSESTFTMITRDGATSVNINGTPVEEKAVAEAIASAKQNGESSTVNVPVGEYRVAYDRVNILAGQIMASEKEKMAAGTAMAGPLVSTQRVRGKSEDLGKQTIEGVIADGTRTTSTIDAGTIGNDRPIQVVSERWYSSELQTVLMTKTTDPRTGESIFSLTNVHRGEPGAYLFQVPAGYTVADRK